MERISAMDQGKSVISPATLEEEWQSCVITAPVLCSPALQGAVKLSLGKVGRMAGLKHIFYHLCRHKTDISAELVF